MAVRPLITMEAGDIKAQVEAIGRALDRELGTVVDATKRALDQLAEEMLAQAQANANVVTGRLQESGTTEAIVVEGSALVKRWGFHTRYARQRDQGGPIVPVNGQLLAIPLDPIKTAAGASRYVSPLEEPDLDLVKINGRLFLLKRQKGEGGGQFRARDLDRFHWMLVPRVNQTGSQYASKVVAARAADVPRRVAEEIGKSLGGAA